MMAKAEVKTKKTEASVEEFLNGILDEQKREDSKKICGLMQNISGAEPKMWGASIIGFGTYHYKSKSGREGDWMRIGFSPRKQNLTVYIMNGFERYDELMAKLGKHKTGKSCLYIKRLSDIDLEVLKELINLSAEHFENKYGKN
jgi:nucleoid DNA-binding protein